MAADQRAPRRHDRTSLRDAALRRLQRSNRWLIAGSVALTGVFAEVAANAFPGKTLKTTGGSRTGGHPHSGAKTSTQPVKPPVQAPTATPEAQAPAEESSPSTSGESVPSQEPAPAEEAAPSSEPAPSRESAPAHESAPPVRESAPPPAPERAPPVVSGGS
jgi:hypothetical protein